MRKEVNILLHKALDSLVLSIDHFNRPWNQGREEAVLILLDRSFELVLKSIILEKGGKIRDKRSNETIGIDKCIRKCVSDYTLKCLKEEQAITIQIINSLRDAAQHYILEISEQELYVYCQAGLTLFNQLIKSIFNQSLSQYIPDRVLPISSSPPKDYLLIVKDEFNEIKRLVAPHLRKRIEARAKLRSLAIVESSLGGERAQPSNVFLDRLLTRIQNGETYQYLFPGISRLRLDTSGTDLSISIRLTRKEGEPIQLVPEGTPGSTVVAVKKVNELSFYCFGLYELAKRLNYSPFKLLAVIQEMGIQSDLEYFKEIKIGSQKFKRYSIKAEIKLKNELPKLNIDKIWENHKPKGRKKVT